MPRTRESLSSWCRGIAAVRRWFSRLVPWWWHRSPARQQAGESRGAAAERLVALHYEHLGYRVLARNVKTRYSEIDLVVEQGLQLVIVEVKARSEGSRGRPDEAITSDKQHRLTRAALAYLKRQGWLKRSTRFDVATVFYPAGSAEPVISLYHHAFEASAEGQDFA